MTPFGYTDGYTFIALRTFWLATYLQVHLYIIKSCSSLFKLNGFSGVEQGHRPRPLNARRGPIHLDQLHFFLRDLCGLGNYSLGEKEDHDPQSNHQTLPKGQT